MRETFGVWLLRHREGAKLTIRELGERSNIHWTTIAKIESGVRKANATQAERLARALEADTDEAQALAGVVLGPDTPVDVAMAALKMRRLPEADRQRVLALIAELLGEKI